MSRIRAVLIDFGGVLYQTPDSAQIRRWLRFFGVTDMGLLSLMTTSPLESEVVMEIMTGKKPEQQVWDELAKLWRVRPGVLRFLRRRSLSRKRMNRELLALVHHLRPRYQTAVLTNAASDFRSTFGQAFNLEKVVDQLIVSAEVGLAKPDPEIFNLAAGRLSVRPDEAVFIDDMAENVESASRIGMRSLLHTTTAETVRWLQQVLNE